jgi:hypothetical protein
MIATAFVENDIDKILDAGLAAVDSKSQIADVVATTRKLCREHSDDWRATRREIKHRWQKHGGAMRDRNGYELNTACTIAALIYGHKDFTETLRIAFNFGWDADNNAATAGTIVGVIKGRRWMNDHGWKIRDVYRNTTRDHMPNDETITRFENKLIQCARITIHRAAGQIPLPFREGPGEGSRSSPSPSARGQGEGALVYIIPTEPPKNIEPLTTAADQLARLRQYIPTLKQTLREPAPAPARAAYVAICLGEAQKLKRESPQAWSAAIAELQNHRALVRDLFQAPSPQGDPLRAEARRAGLRDPTNLKRPGSPPEE